jgi:hypothetical protein
MVLPLRLLLPHPLLLALLQLQLVLALLFIPIVFRL